MHVGTSPGSSLLEKEETSADHDTDDSDDDEASLFPNSFPVNSHFEFHSVDDVNPYCFFFLFLLS